MALIARYQCNEGTGITLSDSRGNGHHATLVPNVAGAWTGGTWAGGRYGGGLSFNGTSGYADGLTSLIGSNPGAFTLACWVNGSASLDKRIIAFGSSTDGIPAISLQTAPAASPGKVSLWWRNNTDLLVGGSGVYIVTSTATAFDNTWHHVAVTYDGTTARVYVDGLLSGATTITVIGATVLNRTAIGALLRASSGSWYGGLGDEFEIYDTSEDARIPMIANDTYPPRNKLLGYPGVIRTNAAIGINGIYKF